MTLIRKSFKSIKDKCPRRKVDKGQELAVCKRRTTLISLLLSIGQSPFNGCGNWGPERLSNHSYKTGDPEQEWTQMGLEPGQAFLFSFYRSKAEFCPFESTLLKDRVVHFWHPLHIVWKVVGIGLWKLNSGVGEGKGWGCLDRLKLKIVTCELFLSGDHPTGEWLSQASNPGLLTAELGLSVLCLVTRPSLNLASASPLHPEMGPGGRSEERAQLGFCSLLSYGSYLTWGDPWFLDSEISTKVRKPNS